MGIGGSKNDAARKLDSATALEEQWMDPHKRKVLAAVEDTIEKCRQDGLPHHDQYNTADIIKSIRRLCAVSYSANDFELIQKCQDTFTSLAAILQSPHTAFLLRLEIVSAVSVLCQGNQVNCRTWCAQNGIEALLGQLREIPMDRASDQLHQQALQMNIWVIYTLRTLMCASPEAIKTTRTSPDFAKMADLMLKMCQLKSVWQRTAEQQNYALDCCVFLGIGGLQKRNPTRNPGFSSQAELL